MKKKFILSLIIAPLLCSCAGLFNGIKEFGDATITADYFFKDYSDFFFYKDRDFVCVAHSSSSVKRGECVSALNGKQGNTYRFFSFANYEESQYLVVNKYNKLKKIDEDYFYASKDAPDIPLEYLSFPYEIQDRETVSIDSKLYIYYDESVQPIEKGEAVVAKNGKTYYFVKDYSNWIMKTEGEITKLFYFINMPTFEVHMSWLAKDITIK